MDENQINETIDNQVKKAADKIVNFVNKWSKVITILGAATVIILLSIQIFVRDPQYYKDSKKEIKLSQDKVDSMRVQNDSFNLRLQNLETGQMMFLNIIKESNQNQQDIVKKIDNLKRYFNEKINNVNKYSISDLDSFFRAKYPGYYQEEGN